MTPITKKELKKLIVQCLNESQYFNRDFYEKYKPEDDLSFSSHELRVIMDCLYDGLTKYGTICKTLMRKVKAVVEIRN